ncbi:MAG TPA: cytochrome P450 [Roseomonas sp.]
MSLSDAICGLLYDLARTRNGGNVEIDLNGVPVLLVQNLEDADRILRLNVANYRKNMAWFRLVLGMSRFSEEGEAWEIRRALTHQLLTRFDRERTFAASRDRGLAAVRQMLASGAPVIDDDILREMTVSVLLENFFDASLSDTNMDLGNMASLMEHGSAYSFVPAGQTGSLHREKLMQIPPLRSKALADLKVFRDGTIPRTPMLDGMLAADATPATGVVLEHELMSLFAAGAETSAAAMSWACYLLAANPAVQEALRRSAIAFWQSDAPDWAHLSRLADHGAFISEALRLYPPTPIVGRFAVAADRLGEHEITAGQNLLISFVGIQHDARLRADPWALDIGGGAGGRAAGAATSFSMGPRVCGGKHFALVELVTFLSVFLTEARFELTSDAAPSYVWKSVMLRAGGQPVRAVPLA